jgi:shikimate kinase
MRPLDIQTISDDTEKNAHGKQSVVDEANISECSNLIDLHLPVELRSIYLRIKAGESVPKIKKQRVEQAIKEILNGRKEAE